MHIRFFYVGWGEGIWGLTESELLSIGRCGDCNYCNRWRCALLKEWRKIYIKGFETKVRTDYQSKWGDRLAERVWWFTIATIKSRVSQYEIRHDSFPPFKEEGSERSWIFTSDQDITTILTLLFIQLNNYLMNSSCVIHYVRLWTSIMELVMETMYSVDTSLSNGVF